MEGAAGKLALFWLNSLVEVPTALLLPQLADLADGAVLCDVTRELQVGSRFGVPVFVLCDTHAHTRAHTAHTTTRPCSANTRHCTPARR